MTHTPSTHRIVSQCLRPLAPLLATIFMVASQSARAENIDLLMSSLFPAQQLNYIGYTSVEREEVQPRSLLERKFLIVDFRFQQKPVEENLQASIHTICMAMIRDRDLMQRLTNQGYDMVSVAFDRRSQYDCL